MEEEEVRRKLTRHEVGMGLDAMSVEELEARILMLEAEIVRLKEAIAARAETRSAAEALFRL
ncbi:DUF1192 domain-containing protein [Arsenicitalea aurantiaca]|uniref:DUF1192 domain-containing protein n=1 Tax=Arsenicitalea aurantiaca TaxID=1783274 RepID=A0A433XKQ7_9HYPH|nr:DUF1192 domain-containing protein [Arsenicitalea aurantiaca]RUT34633.1 DUF1192 domain-containing protein [Arsenicitalea aurantiaca]